MYYVPHPQSYYYPSRAYHPAPFYPQARPSRYTFVEPDEEQDYYVENKRREYLEALHRERQRQRREYEQQQREYQRALELENQRQRAHLAALAERDAQRRARLRTPHPSAGLPRQRPLDDWQTQLLEELYGVPLSSSRGEPYQQDQLRMESTMPPKNGQIIHQEPETEAEQVSDVDPSPFLEVPPRNTPPPSQSLANATIRVPISSPAASDTESEDPKRAKALEAISKIADTFENLKREFTFPSGPLERNPHSQKVQLAYNAANAPIHAYENALSELLTKLDAVESHGFKAVREARKGLVNRIEEELADLDKKILGALNTNSEETKTEMETNTETETEIESVENKTE